MAALNESHMGVLNHWNKKYLSSEQNSIVGSLVFCVKICLYFLKNQLLIIWKLSLFSIGNKDQFSYKILNLSVSESLSNSFSLIKIMLRLSFLCFIFFLPGPAKLPVFECFLFSFHGKRAIKHAALRQGGDGKKEMESHSPAFQVHLCPALQTVNTGTRIVFF